MNRFIIFAVLFAGYYAYAEYSNSFDAKIEVQAEEEYIKVNSGDYYVEYDIENEFNLDNYKVVSFGRSHKSMKNFGVAYDLSVLPEKKYTEFKNITSRGQCGASFLNTYAEMLLLVPGNKKSYERLTKTNYDQGDDVYLSLKNLSFSYAEFKGQGFDEFEFRGAIPVLYER